MMSENIEHSWRPNRKPDGSLDFRMNRQLSNKPILLVRCDMTGARTWFTREQWDDTPDSERAIEDYDDRRAATEQESET